MQYYTKPHVPQSGAIPVDSANKVDSDHIHCCMFGIVLLHCLIASQEAKLKPKTMKVCLSSSPASSSSSILQLEVAFAIETSSSHFNHERAFALYGIVFLSLIGHSGEIASLANDVSDEGQFLHHY